jgi:NTE family protein
MPDGNPGGRPPHYDKKIGWVVQGGGALGSYQAGVYEALASSVFGIFARLGSGDFDRCD